MKSLKTYICGAIIFLFLNPASLLSFEGEVPHLPEYIDHIEGQILIEPQKDFLSVKLRYDYVVEEERTNKVQLFLENKFKLLDLDCPELMDFEISQNHLFGDLYQLITLYLKTPVKKGQALPISLEYECRQNFNHFKGHQLPRNWIEISPNTLEIVPRHVSLSKKITFNIALNIQADYEVLSPADVTRRAGGWNIASLDPCLGFYAIVGKNFNREFFQKGTNLIELVSTNLEETVKKQMVESIDRCLNFYNNSFAANAPKHFVKAGVRPYAKWDAQYACVNNYFVTYQEGPKQYLKNQLHHFSNIAHEISHFWWNAADAGSLDNWLNESLAEYSAFLAIRAIYGEKIFKGFLKACRKDCKKKALLPGPDQFEFKTLLYKKGPYLLYRLEKRMGREKFQTLLINLIEKKVKTTSQFGKELQSLAGSKTASKFEKRLRG